MQNLGQQVDAWCGGDIGQTYESRVTGTTVHEPSEVGVDGDQDPALACCHLDDRFVTRIRTQSRHLNRVVTLRPEPVRQPMTGAAIDEESHLAT